MAPKFVTFFTLNVTIIHFVATGGTFCISVNFCVCLNKLVLDGGPALSFNTPLSMSKQMTGDRLIIFYNKKRDFY